MAEKEDTDKTNASEIGPVQELYDLMREQGLESLEIKNDDLRIRLSRKPSSLPAAQSGLRASPVPSVTQQSIATPLAGVFYRASSPTAAPFVKEGDTVEPGQTLCIVEAMKVMNEIKAESRLRIVQIVAENSRPVAAGQALFLVEKA
jgi:acetyl/propionyl-CoA carboxylase alpha subunit